MRKPDPKTVTKEEVEQYIKYLLSKHPAFMGAEITISLKDKKNKIARIDNENL